MFHTKKIRNVLYIYICTMDFTTVLLAWHKKHQRHLIWKNTKDPYAIWVSEIILQQTRVEQAKDYYIKFLSAFPTVYHLAQAKEEDILRLWQGLGYYTRARNMHKTAKKITTLYNGVFPASVQELQKFNGIGPYTAAAIGSFAFGLPVAALDANGYRILTRYFGISDPLSGTKAKGTCNFLAEKMLPREKSDRFNQALMDFGSLVCTSRPRCNLCPLSEECIAYKEDKTHLLPVRHIKKPVRNRYFHYLVFLKEAGTYIRRRDNNDIWQGLYEFPLVETSKPVSYKKLCNTEAFSNLLTTVWGTSIPFPPPSHTYVMPAHKLSHQTIHAVFYQIPWITHAVLLKETYIQVAFQKLPEYAVPKLIENYLCFFSNFVGL